MKLAVLGVVTAGLGVGFTVPGLVGIGVFWVVIGLVARAFRNRLEHASPDAVGTQLASRQQLRHRLATDGRAFTLSTLLWLTIGIPSAAVGVLRIGIPADQADWRWLPLAVGAAALVIGVVGGVLYGAGSLAVAAGGTPDKPATLWIRAVRETGTFVNDRPRMEFELHVEPDATTGLTAYDVTKKATVPFIAMGSLRVGDGFRGLVAGPGNPTSMEISWDSPVPGSTTTGTHDAPKDVADRLDGLAQLRDAAKISEEEYQAQRQRILGSL